MLRRLTDWIDRDWKRRRYFALFAFRQRFVWIVPALAAYLLISLAEALGVSSTGPFALAIAVAGLVGTLLLFSLSIYRWFVGYGRTGEQAKRGKIEVR